MDICHDHNLTRDLTEKKPYGIRVTLPPGDTFSRLLGADWQQFHWYATSQERDRALQDMASEHLYSRRGDRPSVILQAVDRDEQSD